MTAPVGANVGLYMDTPHQVHIGDHIVTESGRTYRVTDVRVQKRGKHTGRKHLRCDVLQPGQRPNDPDAVVHRLRWYAR